MSLCVISVIGLPSLVYELNCLKCAIGKRDQTLQSNSSTDPDCHLLSE